MVGQSALQNIPEILTNKNNPRINQPHRLICFWRTIDKNTLMVIEVTTIILVNLTGEKYRSFFVSFARSIVELTFKQRIILSFHFL